MKRLPCLLLVFAAVLLMSTNIYADELRSTISPLEIINKTFPDAPSSAMAINNKGDIAVLIGEQVGGQSVLLSNGKIIRLGMGYPISINNRGDVLMGTLKEPKNGGSMLGKGMLWTRKTQIKRGLGVLSPHTTCTPLDLNDKGQVVGICRNDEIDFARDVTSFMYYQGKMTAFRVQKEKITWAFGINNKGEIVGQNGFEAFVYRKGKITNLGKLPSFRVSLAIRVNNNGVVLGMATDAEGSGRPFLWNGGKLHDLGSLTGYSRFADAICINNKNHITGTSNSKPFF